MASRGPAPTQVLHKWASIENLMTWTISGSITKDPWSFMLFMRHAADRIPVAEKIKMLTAVVNALPDPGVIYEGLAEDLRIVNQLRVDVAHSVVIDESQAHDLAGYVKIRRGIPVRTPDEDMRARMADANKRIGRITKALATIPELQGSSLLRAMGLKPNAE